MRSTVEPGLPGSPVPERIEHVGRFINRELLPVLRALRDAANYQGTQRSTATTDGTGVYARLWTSGELALDATVTVRASVVGTAAAAGGSQHAGYLLCATFQSTGGVVTQTGATSVLYAHESAAAIDARFGVDSTARTAYVEVRDDATAAMVFAGVTEALEGPR